MSTAVLVEIRDLKEQMSINWDDHDARLQSCLDRSEGIVLNHCKVDLTDSPAWTSETVPANVSAAIIIVAKGLFTDQPVWLTDTVRSLLVGYRDPTLA